MNITRLIYPASLNTSFTDQGVCSEGGREGGRERERERDSPSVHLRQFEDVLFPVGDLEGSVGHPFPDVSRVQPSVLVQSLFRLLLVFKVAPEHTGTLDTDLPAQRQAAS